MTNKKFKQLVKFLSLFENKNHYLAKFLLDNNLLNQHFLSKLENVKHIQLPYFKNINEMDDFFEELLSNNESTGEENVQKTNKKLDNLVKNEEYEKAIKLRDYMIRKNIPRI